MSWGRLDPNETEVIGRQPATLYISPSKSYPWYGDVRGGVRGKLAVSGGERFTTQQEESLIERGMDPLTCETITVKRQACGRTEIVPMLNSLQPVFAFECPVISRRADGKIKVIAPNGDAKFIRADGWAHKPTTRPYQGGYY